MVPEVLGLLIIVGALLVLIVKFIAQRQKGVDTEELRVSTEKLKAELAHSADAVIARMSSHIKHLEDLLRQADERNGRLEAGLGEYRRLAGELEQRSAELNRELNEARKTIAELSAYQTRTMVPPLPVMPQQMPLTMAPQQPAVQPVMERVDAQDFASVLQNSMEREAAAEALQDEPAINAQQAAGLAEAMNRHSDEEEPAAAEETPAKAEKAEAPVEQRTVSPNAAKASALLRSGYSVEETARETGMGRGAIELLREMNKRDLE